MPSRRKSQHTQPSVPPLRTRLGRARRIAVQARMPEQVLLSIPFVISVASEMVTLKRFCAVVKALIINFFQKNSFYPMPDATFLKVSGAKFELLITSPPSYS